MCRKRLRKWFKEVNNRRGELIFKETRTPEEEKELEHLQKIVGEEIERVYPRPPIPKINKIIEDILSTMKDD